MGTQTELALRRKTWKLEELTWGGEALWKDADPDLPVVQEAKARFAGLHLFQCNLALRISLLHLGACG